MNVFCIIYCKQPCHLRFSPTSNFQFLKLSRALSSQSGVAKLEHQIAPWSFYLFCSHLALNHTSHSSFLAINRRHNDRFVYGNVFEALKLKRAEFAAEHGLEVGVIKFGRINQNDKSLTYEEKVVVVIGLEQE